MWDAQSPMGTAAERQLASYERHYRDLARRLSEIGYIASGSVAQRVDLVRQGLLRLPRRSSSPARAVLALHRQSGWQDREQTPHRERGAPLRAVDRQRPHRPLPLAEMRTVAAEAQALILAEESSDQLGHGHEPVHLKSARLLSATGAEVLETLDKSVTWTSQAADLRLVQD